jgi:hypothetical protein
VFYYLVFCVSLSFSFFAWAEELETIQVPAGQTQSISAKNISEFEAAEVILNSQSLLILSDFKSIRIQRLVVEE